MTTPFRQGGDICSDLPAQVQRQLGVRFRNRLVLADEAAELLGQGHGALRRDRVLLGRDRVLRECDERRQRQDEQEEEARHDFCSSFTSGRIFVCSASGVIGPMCL
jgi:hypothetical protein